MTRFDRNRTKVISEPADADELDESDEEFSDYSDEEVEETGSDMNLLRSIILSLNTCYHVGLQNEQIRREFRENVAPIFGNDKISPEFIAHEINICYEVFLDEIQLPNARAG